MGDDIATLLGFIENKAKSHEGKLNLVLSHCLYLTFHFVYCTVSMFDCLLKKFSKSLTVYHYQLHIMLHVLQGHYWRTYVVENT